MCLPDLADLMNTWVWVLWEYYFVFSFLPWDHCCASFEEAFAHIVSKCASLGMIMEIFQTPLSVWYRADICHLTSLLHRLAQHVLSDQITLFFDIRLIQSWHILSHLNSHFDSAFQKCSHENLSSHPINAMHVHISLVAIQNMFACHIKNEDLKLWHPTMYNGNPSIKLSNWCFM